MKMRFLIIFTLIFYGFTKTSVAQCYIQKTNISGFNTSAFQSQLDIAACILKDSLPSEFQSQFKVITFDFYIESPLYDLGTEQSIDISKSIADTESLYYLLISRQSDPSGIYTKFHIDLKLPTSGAFSCLDSIKVRIIKQTILQAINTKYQSKGESPYFYAEAEIAGINVLSKIFGSIKSGNCCLPSDELAEDWLIYEGFVKLEIEQESTSNPKVIGPIISKSEVPSARMLNDYVIDYAQLLLQIKGESINLELCINEVLEDSQYVSANPKFYIIKNSSICNGEYDSAVTQISQNLPFLGGILYIQDKADGPDNLYLKIMGMTPNEMPNYVADMGDYQGSGSCGAISFIDLINTVRQAEDSLIAHGYGKIEDRVKILRGLYYGTDWCMDRSQSYGSELRNAGFKLYLCDLEDPINPNEILGTTLYNKLRCSPEVKNGTLGVDWGHIIIGMEARLSFCAREVNVVLPPHVTTGLENTTWIGDIGGGAGMLSYRRIANPSKRAIDMFNDENDFGGWFNVEGDIAAFLVGRDTESFDHTPSVQLTDDEYIADALESYLLPQPAPPHSEYYKRGRLFLSMLGGKFDDDGTLTNEHDLAKELAKKVIDFAEYYLVNMSFNTEVDFQEASKHIGGASLEMTYLFINALKNVGYSPGSRALPRSFNPNPTPPGAPYESVKFTSRRRLEEIKREIERRINDH